MKLDDYRVIAQIMCDITREVVWPYLQTIMKESGYECCMMGELVTRVGSGRRSCLRWTFVDNFYPKYTITYGVKTIMDKHDFRMTHCYLSTSEIKDRGYYEGRLECATSLAHLILHEVSHALQVSIDWKRDKNHHNDDFYAILSGLSERCDQEVLDELIRRTALEGIELCVDPETYTLSEEGEMMLDQPRLEVNSVVSYLQNDGSRSLGVIMKAGEDWSSLAFYHGNFKGRIYKVPSCRIGHLHPGEPRPDPRTDITQKIDWNVGDYCHFYKDGDYLGGRIVEVNKKTCLVRVLEGNLDKMRHEINSIFKVHSLNLKKDCLLSNVFDLFVEAVRSSHQQKRLAA